MEDGNLTLFFNGRGSPLYISDCSDIGFSWLARRIELIFDEILVSTILRLVHFSTYYLLIR
jgi:hypothetical protein